MILAIKAFWITLCVATLVSRPVYQFLLGLKSRQVISAFVPEGHQAKVGTPNMGGWIPVIGMIFMFVYFLFLPTSSMIEALGYSSTTTLMTVITPNYVYGVLSLLIGYALLGFADDYLVPKMKPGKRGIDWLPKLGLQIILALPCAWLTSNWNLPNAGATLFMILFFANAYNFSDGLDALAGSLLIGICVGMLVMGVMASSGITMLISAGLLGGIIPFLFFNAPPAKVFMGDTGSLPIGGLLGVGFWKLAMIGQQNMVLSFWGTPKLSLWFVGLVLLAGMMIAELVPVPLQILSVKLFKRKLFPFTPIHHAFEKAGWKETRVVWSFALVQLLLTVAALTFAAVAFNPSMAPTP
jgi:phospho-N-acetylmuramoyl-pentapeptide-transferase